MFDRRNHYYEGYEQARMKGVPLTELYATAYNAWVSDSSMTLRESEELEVYMDSSGKAFLTTGIPTVKMLQSGTKDMKITDFSL